MATKFPIKYPNMPDIVTDPDAKGKMELKLYKFTEFYDKVEYAINRKGPNKIDGVNGKDIKIGYIDCSGWVATALNKTMEEINKSQGKKGEKDMFDVVDGANAAMILEKAKKAGSKVITGYDIADKLKEGMVIVENNPRESPKYDHIVMVVRDKSGKLYVSQSKAPEKDENGKRPGQGGGVELQPLDEYLQKKEDKGVKLYACDPLTKVRHLLKEHRNLRAEAEHSGAVELTAFKQSGAVGEQVQGIDSTLNHASRSLLLSEKTHPDHPLYTQAVAKLEQLGPQAFASRQQLENAAGSLVSEAKGIGMQRIDVVIQNRDGTGLFVVQGNPNDPASPRIYTDKSVATERSLAQSSNALLQDAQGQQQEQQRPRGSVIC